MIAELPGFPGIPDLSKLATVPGPKVAPVRPFEDETLTVEQLAAYWGVTPVSVRSAAWREEIPGCVKWRGKYFFDKEVALAGWIPPSIQTWADGLNLPVATPIAEDSELTIEGGKRALLDAALARLHDLHVLVTPTRWAKVIIKAVDQAEEGDWRARKWLGDYLMGPPVQRVEAEVDVKTSRSYTDEMRARAIEALLSQVRVRTVIDVPIEESETSREGAS